MIGKLNHVAIAVPDLKKASDFYRTTLGALVSDPQELEDNGVLIEDKQDQTIWKYK